MGYDFDKNCCCVCFKTICIDYSLYGIIAVINALLAISGSVFILVSLLQQNREFPNILIAGLIIHGVSLLIELFLTGYPGRYWYGMESPYDTKRDNCCCCRFPCYSFKTYALWTVYGIIILILILSLLMANVEQSNNIFIGLIIYFGSSMLIIWWSAVFKPSSSRGFYDDSGDDYVGFDATFSLVMSYIFSFVIMNIAFGIYYVDIVYHVILCAMGIIFTFISVLAQIIFFCTKNNAERGDVIYPWFGFLLLSGTSSICTFFYVIFGFTPDPKYPQASREKQIFFIVQGSIVLLIMGLILLYCLIKLFTCIPKRIEEAKEKVKGYQSQSEF